MNQAGQLGMMRGGAKWKNPYVTDGLIAMWDGEWNAGTGKHDANATVWKDLSGNGHDIIFSSSEFGSNFFLVKETISQLCEVLDNLTMEFLYEQPDKRTGSWEPTLEYGNRGLTIYRTSSTIMGIVAADGTGNMSVSQEGKATSMVFPAPQTASVSSLYSNGTRVGSLVKTYNISNTMNGKVGFRGAERNLKVFYLRIYSRALTADEIAANYAVDKARFNLP